MSQARVLVTGATGVVGRLVVPQLVARGHRVTAVARTAEKHAELAARMTNARLERAGGWTPRWRSARQGLRAAVGTLFQHEQEGASAWARRKQSW